MCRRAGGVLPLVLRHPGDCCLAALAKESFRQGCARPIPSAIFWRGLMGTLAMGLGFAGLGYCRCPRSRPWLRGADPDGDLRRHVPGRGGAAVPHLGGGAGPGGVLIVVYPRLTVLSATARALPRPLAPWSCWAARCLPRWRRSLCASWFRWKRRHHRVLVLGHGGRAGAGNPAFGWVWPTPRDCGLLVGAGLLGGVGQILLTTSYREPMPRSSRPSTMPRCCSPC